MEWIYNSRNSFGLLATLTASDFLTNIYNSRNSFGLLASRSLSRAMGKNLQ